MRAAVREIAQITERMGEVCELISVPLDELLKNKNNLPKEIVPKISVSLPRVVFGDDENILLSV